MNDLQPITEHDLSTIPALLDGYYPAPFRGDEICPVEVEDLPEGLESVPRRIGAQVDWSRGPGMAVVAAKRAAWAIHLDREIDLWMALEGQKQFRDPGPPWADVVDRLRHAPGKTAWLNLETATRVLELPEVARCLSEDQRCVLMGEGAAENRRTLRVITGNQNERPLPVIEVVAARYVASTAELRYVLGPCAVFVDPGSGKTWRQKQPDGSGWKVEEYPIEDVDPAERSLVVVSTVEAVEVPKANCVLDLSGCYDG